MEETESRETSRRTNGTPLRVGIYGGSFNPVHNGHVAAAAAFMKQMWLDLLFVVPAGIPPHKYMWQQATPAQRLHMCELAFSEIDGVVVSDIEIARGGKSYTVDTLRAFSRPNVRLFLLCGTDMMLTLDDWREPEEIFALSHPVYIRREMDDPILMKKIVKKIEAYRYKYGSVVRRILAEPVLVSSTEVRKKIQDGQDITKLVPPAVAEYIAAHDLYKEGHNNDSHRATGEICD